jgi:molecular chaperone DnaK (HSP70)
MEEVTIDAIDAQQSEVGVMRWLVRRNATIPVIQTQIFTTYKDDQSEMFIQVYEGERQLTKENTLIGTFVLSGIAAAKKGVPQIELTFDIDANGTLSVSARDMATDKIKNLIKLKGLYLDYMESRL